MHHITSFQQTNRVREKKRINKNQNFLIGHTVALQQNIIAIMLVELIKIELECLDKTKWEIFKKNIAQFFLKNNTKFYQQKVSVHDTHGSSSVVAKNKIKYYKPATPLKGLKNCNENKAHSIPSSSIIF